MRTKQEILLEIQEGLSTGILTESDLGQLIAIQSQTIVPQVADPGAIGADEPRQIDNKLSAVDIMYYIAGIVLFSTIMSSIILSWNGTDHTAHILLSVGVGIILWFIAYYLTRNPSQGDVRKGLINALLLTGSLLMVVGGYIVSNVIVDGFNQVNYIATAVTLVVLGMLFLSFDKVIKRNLVLFMGILLAIASFPALLFGILQDSELPIDAWFIIIVMASGLLVYATRVAAKMNPDRENIDNGFDTFAVFLGLMSMYVASYTDYDIAWVVILIASVLGIFYLSIVTQNKQLLKSGSFFMILTIITISFRYFSGLGVTVSLIVATLGLLGTAVVISSINKKYFKQPVQPKQDTIRL